MSRQITAKRLDRPQSLPGSNFQSTNLDLALATLIALGLPFACQWLFDHAGGALTALLLYYGVCCIAALNYGALPNYQAPLPGFLLTILIWVPLNAAMEQLSWFYVLDSWRNRWQSGVPRWLGLIVGILLLIILVTLIHLLFWVHFLPTSKPTPYAWIGILLNLLLTASYGALYYRSRSMFPTFFIRLLADLQLVLLAHYSIFPYLI